MRQTVMSLPLSRDISFRLHLLLISFIMNVQYFEKRMR